jgi:hypothetical protein
MRFSHYVIPAVLGLLTVNLPVTASAQVAISITVPIAPPALPVYVQPPIPEPGYLWTPGYWGYAQDGGYYWVPGTWVRPPEVGLLWTPAWWGFNDGVYGFHSGYWGSQVGFYGGIDYGYGYGGVGFIGGRWDNGRFAYNSAVNNFGGVHITNVYRENVVHRESFNRVSFNGGNGGIQARPSAAQEAFEHDRHIPPTGEQAHHFEAAASNPALRAEANHGRPAVAATGRPGEFSGHGVVGARAAGPGSFHGGDHGPMPGGAAHGPAAGGGHPPANVGHGPANVSHGPAGGGHPAPNVSHGPANVSHGPAGGGHPPAGGGHPQGGGGHPAGGGGHPPAAAHAPAQHAAPKGGGNGKEHH